MDGLVSTFEDGTTFAETSKGFDYTSDDNDMMEIMAIILSTVDI